MSGCQKENGPGHIANGAYRDHLEMCERIRFAERPNCQSTPAMVPMSHMEKDIIRNQYARILMSAYAVEGEGQISLLCEMVVLSESVILGCRCYAEANKLLRDLESKFKKQ
jgi:hypothetical protein